MSAVFVPWWTTAQHLSATRSRPSFKMWPGLNKIYMFTWAVSWSETLVSRTAVISYNIPLRLHGLWPNMFPSQMVRHPHSGFIQKLDGWTDFFARKWPATSCFIGHRGDLWQPFVSPASPPPTSTPLWTCCCVCIIPVYVGVCCISSKC